MKPKKFLGIIIDSAYVADEGMTAVFDNLERVGAQAIALWPMLLQEDQAGGRMPDLHIDGHRRLLGRPLWGKQILNVRGYLPYWPNLNLYRMTPYTPPPPAPPTLDRALPAVIIAEAKRRGMQVHLGITPFLPGGIRPQDRPVMVNAEMLPPPYIGDGTCLNNPAGQAYALASITDMLNHYSEVDGLMLDWIEFGAYRLEEHFTCFCVHCRQQMTNWGYNTAEIESDVKQLWDRLHGLTGEDLMRARDWLATPEALTALLCQHNGWCSFLEFKAQSVADFYDRARRLLDSMGLQAVTLTARSWCQPWNLSSGSDFQMLAHACDAVAPKLFRFDHAVLPRWSAERLLDWNPDLDESAVLDTAVRWMNLPDNRSPRRLDNYNIPAPDEAHPVQPEAYRHRLEEMAGQLAGKALCYPTAHPYLPDDQWAEMVALVRDSPVDGMWVNMYGYLTDNKLEILRENWQ